MKNLTNSIAAVAVLMTSQINNDVEILGADLMNGSWFNTMIDCVIESEGVSFENDNAESFYKTAVIKSIDHKAYEIVFPKMLMDENGEYTTDSTKWV